MLRTGPVDDPLEREADRVADVLPTGMSIEPFPEMPPAVRRKCTECEVEDQAGQRPSPAQGDGDLQPHGRDGSAYRA
jgi:hypothetical protein